MTKTKARQKCEYCHVNPSLPKGCLVPFADDDGKDD